jgi:putative membrane protein
MAALTGMFIFHGFCSHWTTLFAEDRNINSEKYYRIANEIPTLLMLVIVVMVIVKPF